MIPLPVDCNDCGACCWDFTRPPYGYDELGPLERNRPHVYRDYLAVEGVRTRYRKVKGRDLDGPCGFFDVLSGECRHYADRPDVCREYPLGGQSCQAKRRAIG